MKSSAAMLTICSFVTAFAIPFIRLSIRTLFTPALLIISNSVPVKLIVFKQWFAGTEQCNRSRFVRQFVYCSFYTLFHTLFTPAPLTLSNYIPVKLFVFKKWLSGAEQ